MTESVLIIDDNVTFREAVRDALEHAGYAVAGAGTGEEGLRMASARCPSLVIVEAGLPGIDGLTVIRHLRLDAALRSVPCILLTGALDQETELRALDAGADAYIIKSSDFEVLKARVRALIRRKQFEDESRRIRDALLTKELEAREAQAARELAETRAALVRDLERKNEELDLARRQAERLSSFKSQFLADMSHELRTPLNAIIGFSELLTDEANGPLSEAQREFVNYVLDGGRHLLTLINDILDLAKIEAGRVELHHQAVAPRALIESAREIIRPFALKQGVTVTVRQDAGVEAISVDPVRVKQVLFNLLSNAVKFTPPGGTVTLDSTISEGCWVVGVTDTGVGIRAQDLPRLFREFERIESTSGPKPEGTGLGLALTKRLVELHGGTITVASTPGQGSTFTVRLPVQPRPARATPT